MTLTSTPEGLAALREMVTEEMAALQPPPKLSVAQWADRERRLSSEASAEPGRWYTDRAPYLRGIMDAISDPTVREVVVMSASQVGKTEALLNCIAFHIAHDPAPILVIQPTGTGGMADSFAKDRLAPMLRDTPALKGKVKDPRSRDSNNTTLHKKFPGDHIIIVGANSPAALASRPIRICLFDEVDRYPASAGSEGDPIQLARKRTATFWNRKVVMVSTPTNKGASRIEAAYEATDQRRYLVPCHDCGEFEPLKWANVHWQKDQPETATYVCEHCGSAWDDAARQRAIKKGEWCGSEPFAGMAGFSINGLCSPWINLEEAVQEFLAAKRLPETLRVWVNTFLSESWEDAGRADRRLLAGSTARNLQCGGASRGCHAYRWR